MKIGIISSAFLGIDNTLEDYITIKNLGYDCLDYQNFINIENDLFAKRSEDFSQHLLKEKRLAQEAGLEFYQAHSPWRYPPRDAHESDRSFWLEQMEKAIYGCALLDCKYFVIHPLMPFGTNENPNSDMFLEINYSFMSSLLDTARENGVTICMENMPFAALPLASVADILYFVKKINSEYFKICLDTGHCIILGDSPGDALRNAAPYIKTLHIHDNNGKDDSHLLPYHGLIDWEDFGEALQEVSYDGCFSLETVIPTKMPADIKRDFDRALFKMAKKISK